MLRKAAFEISHMFTESNMEHALCSSNILHTAWTPNHVNHIFCGARDERFDWKGLLGRG